MKRFASLQRDPWIVLAPDYLYRTPDIPERRLDFGGIFFVGLRELPIEASSASHGSTSFSKSPESMSFAIAPLIYASTTALWICGGRPRKASTWRPT
ncbi:hypothetical protein [Mesorhizobium ventifaucium]|uniref:hypothetical protein n=1 Tax=Mesorhizobium ventifaucium TaxID=666020 RepID=UPI00345C338D